MLYDVYEYIEHENSGIFGTADSRGWLYAGGPSVALLSGAWLGFLFEMLLILCCQSVEACSRAGCLPRVWGLGFCGGLS